MKKKMLSIVELVIWLTMAFVIATSCRNKDDSPPSPTEQELAFEKLSGSWDLSQGGSIVVDGNDESLNYEGFSLSFTDGGYSTGNAGNLFRASGTWTWADQSAGTIQLDDGKDLTITTLTTEQFVFSFQFAGSGGVANGVHGIAGNYTITVNKN